MYTFLHLLSVISVSVPHLSVCIYVFRQEHKTFISFLGRKMAGAVEFYMLEFLQMQKRKTLRYSILDIASKYFVSSYC